MTPRFLTSCLVLAVAEVLASLLIWTGAPTDWVGEPPHFWTYELWRLQYWTLFFAGSAFLWIVAWGGLRRWLPKIVFGLLALALAAAAELLTSLWFWRRLNWNEASFVGWSYFPSYFRDHLIWWAVVVALGLGLWYFYKRRPQADNEERLKP